MNFSDYSIQGASEYLDFLQKTGKGVSIIKVNAIKPCEYKKQSGFIKLSLDSTPKFIDSVKILIGKKWCSDADIRPIACGKKFMIVLPSEKLYYDLLHKFKPSDIELKSDLTFLVERTRDWYISHGNRISLPSVPSNITPCNIDNLSVKPLPAQAEAIAGAFQSPFSYIWGAPGTGKTQVVLSRLVLNYIKNGKKVLICAPTNNAVDQSLFGLMPVLIEAGIDYKRDVARLGIPTDTFAEKYPEVCEASSIAALLSNLAAAINSTTVQKQKTEEYLSAFSKLHAFEKRREQAEQFKADFLLKLPVLQSYISVFDENTILMDMTKSKINALEKQLADYNDKLAKSKMRISSLLFNVSKIESGFFGFLQKSKCEKLKAAADKESEIAVSIQFNIDETVKELTAEKETLVSASERKNSALSSFVSTINQLPPASLSDSILADIIENTNIKNFSSRKQAAILELDGIIDAPLPEDLINKTANQNEAQLRADLSVFKTQLQSLNAELKAVSSGDASRRIEEAKVIAVTIDTAISRIDPSTAEFAHVFLDEAAYSPLIKAATLLSYNCPVTFLGDHMQLPPICEMGKNELKNHQAVCVWALSALYTETALSDFPETLYDTFDNNNAPKFGCLKKYELAETYRFGEKLSKVLAKEVYKFPLKGNPSRNTQIYYIDAPREHPHAPRTSMSEVAKIHCYLKTVNASNLGILCPYNNQLQKLKAEKMIDSENVLTIHGSQGREWETVILSVTDTDDKFFMDSTNRKSGGLNVINTAVSRAKNNLIIVCDYKYWSHPSQSNQLIHKLLDIAGEIKL